MKRFMEMFLGLSSATLWLVLLGITDFNAVTVGVGLLVSLAIVS
jgi:type III secretory pathway component EscS